MKKISHLKVLIIGLKGLGFEITKNLLLSGINSLKLLDNNKCNLRDLGSICFISYNDLNKRRDEAFTFKLKELNENADLEIFKGNIYNINENFEFINLIIISKK